MSESDDQAGWGEGPHSSRSRWLVVLLSTGAIVSAGFLTWVFFGDDLGNGSLLPWEQRQVEVARGLKDPDAIVRRSAAEQLAGSWKLSPPVLHRVSSQVLDEPDDEVRALLTRCLIVDDSEAPEAATLLARLLRDRSPVVRSAAMETAQHLHPVTPEIIAILKSIIVEEPDGQGVRDAWRALALGGNDAIAVILELMDHERVEIRRDAASALWHLRSPSISKEVVQSVRKHLLDDDPGVRFILLQQIHWGRETYAGTEDSLLELYATTSEEELRASVLLALASATASVPSEALEELETWYSSEDLQRRVRSIEIVGRLASVPDTWTQRIREAEVSSNPEVREAAIRADLEIRVRRRSQGGKRQINRSR